jgi:5-(carboxyamino)imidazole ribonucleotide synthase
MTVTVGILGGGQLARMLAIAGAPLGFRFKIVDASPDACASQVAPLIQADYTDLDAMADFAKQVDVVTFDFENVPASTAEFLASRVPVFPNPRALAIAQDRLDEKTLFRSLGLGTPEFAAVDSRADLEAAIASIGAPSILKTRRLGYDGKGQFRLRSAEDADRAWDALGGASLILEAFVPFDREVSVIAVRGRDGGFAAYPLTQNWHENSILSASLAPAPDVERIDEKAFAFAERLAAHLDYVGVFALELCSRPRTARERNGAARPQLRPLDDRGRRHQPVRESSARGDRTTARIDGATRDLRDAELGRRDAFFAPRAG